MSNTLKINISIFAILVSLFLVLFALVSSVQLRLLSQSGQVVYLNYTLQYQGHNLSSLPDNTKYRLQNITIFNAAGSQTLSVSQNTETSLRDIVAPTKLILSPIQVSEGSGELVTSNKLVQLLFAIVLALFSLMMYLILSSNLLLKNIELFKPKLQNEILLPKKLWYVHQQFYWQKKLLLIMSFFLVGKLIYIGMYCILHVSGIISNNVINNITPWDSGYYRSIIYHGYDLIRHSGDGQANWAFFPVFPIVGKSLLFLFNSEYSIIVFNQVLLLISLCLLYLYTAEHYGEKIAQRAIFFLAISGENIYFASIYTESLFVFLSITVLILLDRKRYFLAAIVCGILSGVRMQGVLMSLIVLYHYFVSVHFKISLLTLSKILLLLFLSCSGLIAFMLYLKMHVGDPLAFYHIQSAFGRVSKSWINPIDSLNAFWDGGNGIDQVLSILSIFVFIYFYKQRKYSELLFFTLCFFVEFASKSLQSYSRFFFANYAVYIFLGAYTKDMFRLVFVSFSIFALSVAFIYLWLISSPYVW